MTREQKFKYYDLGNELNNYPVNQLKDIVTIIGFMDNHDEIKNHLLWYAAKISTEKTNEIELKCNEIKGV